MVVGGVVGSPLNFEGHAMLNYALRAVNRARALGLSDTLEYSFHIAKKAAMKTAIDLRYGGVISKTEHGWKPNERGRYMNTPTDIYALDAMTAAANIGPNDVIVDVGCGDGFPIAYWLSRGIKNKIVGVEIDPAIAAKAKARFKNAPSVTIIEGDATIEAAKTGGNVFFLFNPFAEPQTRSFEQSIRGMASRVMYLNYNHIDQFSADNWKIDYSISKKPDYRQYRFARMFPV